MVWRVRPPFLLIASATGAFRASVFHTEVALQGIPVLSHLHQALHNGLVAHLRLMVLAELGLRGSTKPV